MIDPSIKEKIEEAIEFNDPIILLLKTSVESSKRMEVIKMIMKSSMPTKVSNFKIAKKVDKEFIDDMKELERQINEGISNQWIVVFKDNETMIDAFVKIGMEDIPEECVIIELD